VLIFPENIAAGFVSVCTGEVSRIFPVNLCFLLVTCSQTVILSL
jgi:hypothetical protein